MSNIGMMDGAFFVGRKEIVDWINDTLDLNLQKVEQTASGAIACQLLDIMHPGQVSMAKVNWAANKDFEYVANYKVLQTAFTKLHIDRHVDVDRLIKGKYQDNLEFMQWFKRFFELSVQDRGDYDCAGQRLKGKGGAEYNAQFGRSGGSASAAPRVVPRAAAAAPAAAPAAKKAAAAPAAAATKPPAAAPKSNVVRPSSSSAAAATATAAAAPAASAAGRKEVEAAQAELVEARAQVSELNNTVQELRMELDGADKEKDFYFSKLRDIEMMLQDLEDKGEGTELTAAIFKILYATADGFDQAAAEGEGAVVAEEEDVTF